MQVRRTFSASRAWRPTVGAGLTRTLGVTIGRFLRLILGEKLMQFREVAIFTGATFQVPERIQRIDTRATHGWQVRYGSKEERTKILSDFTNDGSGADASLKKAVAELHKRIKRLPAPTGLRTKPATRKTTKLPPGISGPALRSTNSPGRTPYYCYQVSVPLPNGGNTTKAVYIGTENTKTRERDTAALAKAIEIRDQATRKYELAATRAKRAAAAETLTPR